MTPAIEKKLIAAFHKLARESADVEYRFAVWARNAISKLGGSDAFAAWAPRTLGASPAMTMHLITLSSVVEYFVDPIAWSSLGGIANLKKVLTYPEDERANIASEVLAGSSFRVIANRANPVAPRHRARASALDIATADAQKLADYIARTGRNVPREINAIVARYRMRSTAHLGISV